eukprot:6200384-Pleurochrysis_carterae.AAC.8
MHCYEPVDISRGPSASLAYNQPPLVCCFTWVHAGQLTFTAVRLRSTCIAFLMTIPHLLDVRSINMDHAAKLQEYAAHAPTGTGSGLYFIFIKMLNALCRMCLVSATFNVSAMSGSISAFLCFNFFLPFIKLDLIFMWHTKR